MASILTNNLVNDIPQSLIKNMDREKTTPQRMDSERSKEMVQLFKLLADETRIQIINFLAQERELNVRSICQLLGQSQPSVSHHLALLKVAGILDMRREGKHNYYRLVRENIDKIKLLIDAALPF